MGSGKHIDIKIAEIETAYDIQQAVNPRVAL